jgi:hypothetical protein
MQYSHPSPQHPQQEGKWTSQGNIRFPEEAHGHTGERSIKLGSMVSFETALLFNTVAPQNVRLIVIQNAAGNERFSNQRLTPEPSAPTENRTLEIDSYTKSLQEKHWKELYLHMDKSHPPTIVVTENFTVHRAIRENIIIKSLADFMDECIINKKKFREMSFDSLLEGYGMSEEKEVKVTVLFESNETVQQQLLDIIKECLETESAGMLSRKRKESVMKVFVTASFGQILNEENMYEAGTNNHMRKDTNPFLKNITFLKGETYMQVGTVVYLPQRPNPYTVSYTTDPTFRGMLELQLYRKEWGKQDKENEYNIIKCTRTGKEEILDDERETNKLLSYKFTINKTNTQLFEYIVQSYNLDIINDVTPPYRGKGKMIRHGTLSASKLTADQVEGLLKEGTKYEDFGLIRLEDQQGKNPGKTYFSVEIRETSTHEQGRAILLEMMQKELEAAVLFWLIPGTLNRFWVVVDKVVGYEEVKLLITTTNKIFNSNHTGPVNTFLSFTMKGKHKQIIKPVGKKTDTDYSFLEKARQPVGTVIVTGWPCMVNDVKLQAFFGKWNVWLEKNTASFTWFIGVEMEGYVLKIETKDKQKAREILQLKEKPEFDMMISELSHTMQANLRVIGGNTQGKNKQKESQIAKPTPPKLLTAVQIADIDSTIRRGKVPGKVDTPKTLLGRKVQVTQPFLPDDEGEKIAEEKWTEVEKSGKKKDKEKKTEETKKIVKQTQQIATDYSLLGEEEENEIMEENGTEQEESTGKVSDPIPKTTNIKPKKPVNLDFTGFQSCRNKISSLKIWGKNTAGIVNAYCKPLVELGYDIAFDDLKSLILLEKEAIKTHIEKRNNQIEKVSSAEKKQQSKLTITETEQKATVIEEVKIEISSEEEEKKKSETQEPMGMEDAEQEEMAGAQADKEEKKGGAADDIALPQVASPTLPDLPQISIKENPPDATIGENPLPTVEANLSTSKKQPNTMENFFQKKASAPTPPL